MEKMAYHLLASLPGQRRRRRRREKGAVRGAPCGIEMGICERWKIANDAIQKFDLRSAGAEAGWPPIVALGVGPRGAGKSVLTLTPERLIKL